jgi:hypothetical protein
MSPFRRLLMVVGLLVLAASLCLLVVASLPGERDTDRRPLQPPDLTLPTPAAVRPPSTLYATAAFDREATA